ncbi:unnamed protein product, partial [Rotaria sordida]
MNSQSAFPFQSPMRRNRNDFEADDGFMLVENNRSKRCRNQHDQCDSDFENDQENNNNRHLDYPQQRTPYSVYNRPSSHMNQQHSSSDTHHTFLSPNHQNAHLQKLTVSNESTRYTQSRPYSRFVSHSVSGNVKEKAIAND